METRAADFAKPGKLQVGEEQVDTRKPVAWITFTKVIRDTVPVKKDAKGDTIGTMIDGYLNSARTNGDEITSLRLEFNEEGGYRDYFGID